MTRTAAAFAALLACSAASAREVSGVKIPDTVEARGATLRLNGVGARQGPIPQPPYIADYYLAALYLAAPASDPEAILAADAPWVVRMHFIRDASQKRYMDSTRDGFKVSSNEKFKQILPQLERLAPAIPDMRGGQVLVLAYQPGTGLTVGLEGGTRVTVEGKELADAFLRNWLGPHPVDPYLKKGMLGGR
jgi:hypothetical protein